MGLKVAASKIYIIDIPDDFALVPNVAQAIVIVESNGAIKIRNPDGSYTDLGHELPMPMDNIEGLVDMLSFMTEQLADKASISSIPTIPSTLDAFADGQTNRALTTGKKNKLAGIAAGATANQTDAYLLDRAHHTATQSSSTISDFNASVDARISLQKGAASGLTPLGADSKVPALYLPSYVDDVLEFANLAALPVSGETGKIYITINDNKEFRWSGSAYIQIVASPGTTDNVPEGRGNLYFTTARVLATALSGLSTATNSAIAAADSILAALGKLQAQITNNISDISKRAIVYVGSTLVSNPKFYSWTVTTTAGGAFSFSLVDGQGAAIFTTINSVQFEINDADNLYPRSWSISADKKTLTGTLKRAAPTGIIALLQLNLLGAPIAAPVGTSITVTIQGS